jgi:RNA polymerase subunit RPABC4/transcription elongation factor Spt4
MLAAQANVKDVLWIIFQLRGFMNDADAAQTALCKQCKHRIPIEAKLCSTCNSHQDWRGWLAISTSSLALITSIAAVIGIAIPPLYKILHEPRSEAMISMPTTDGTTLRVIATNNGDAAASLGKVWVSSDLLAGATKIRLRNDADAIIQPGSKSLTFDIVPLLDEKKSYEYSIQMLGLIGKKEPAPRTEIRFEVLQSDGSFLIQAVSLDAGQLFHLFRGNADRCSAIQKPDFNNGCVGYGES